jgi:hypothetical protein
MALRDKIPFTADAVTIEMLDGLKHLSRTNLEPRMRRLGVNSTRCSSRVNVMDRDFRLGQRVVFCVGGLPWLGLSILAALTLSPALRVRPPRVPRQLSICPPTGATTTLSSPNLRLRNSPDASARTLAIGSSSFAVRRRSRRRRSLMVLLLPSCSLYQTPPSNPITS